MIGSRKRALEIIDFLKLTEEKKSGFPLYVPAGLDLDAKNPYEIGLSIVAEVLKEIQEAKWT